MIKYVRHGVKKAYAAIALLSIEIIILLAVFSAALYAFIEIAQMIFKEKKETFDQHGFNFLAQYVSDINTNVMQVFTFLGTHTFLIPANLTLIAYFLFIKKHRWYSIKVPVVALSSLLLMFVLKTIFHRNRPLIPLLEAAKGYSFPSGHATMSITFYGLMIYIVWHHIQKTWLKWSLTILLVLLIIFIGVSRVYLRVHYPSDVLAGFCVGLMWLLLSLWILNKIENFSRKKVDPVVESTPT
ncbi:MAG TPA: phosphatase PAP2 family protein [Chitinophagaceae bacterium]|nr:phosphatase PAP2 family protein [Chitinophagaceae bacterium]